MPTTRSRPRRPACSRTECSRRTRSSSGTTRTRTCPAASGRGLLTLKSVRSSAAIRKRYGGAVNAGEPIILDGLIEDVRRLSATPQELDFLDSGKQSKSRILQAFGVNPLIVGEIEGANRAQAVVAKQSFCDNVINPLLDFLGQVFTARVASQFGDGLLVWFEPCSPRDREMRLKEWQLAAKAGAVTGNELRVHLLSLPEDPRFAEPVSPAAGRDPRAEDEDEKRLDQRYQELLAAMREPVRIVRTHTLSWNSNGGLKGRI